MLNLIHYHILFLHQILSGILQYWKTQYLMMSISTTLFRIAPIFSMIVHLINMGSTKTEHSPFIWMKIYLVYMTLILKIYVTTTTSFPVTYTWSCTERLNKQLQKSLSIFCTQYYSENIQRNHTVWSNYCMCIEYEEYLQVSQPSL